jgi:hypothetical protein
MQRILRRGIVVAALLTTITPGLGAPALGAAPADPVAGSTGADWLTGQLTGGVVHNDPFDFDDYGLTIDVALGLAGAGGQDARVAAVAGAVADHVESYTTGVDYGSSDVYAGATAKALHLADVAGQDPTAFGGADLVARLEGLTTDAGPSAGRIADRSDFGDYANTIGQAFAASGLDAAGSDEATAATTYLLDQQCSAGWFRLLFTTDATAADQTCDGGVVSGASKADPDTTSLAVILLADQADDPAVAAALGKAEAWLLAQQHADGSFGGGTSTEASNSNSTGLAGWALGLRGHTAEATRAAVWVRGLQAADTAPCTTGLTGETGAIAYDAAAFTTGRGEGITGASADQWRRASAQALPVLRWAPAATAAYGVTGPTGFVRARTTVSLKVTGLARAADACLSNGAGKQALTGTGATLRPEVRLPAGTARRTFTLASPAGTDKATLRVLGGLDIRLRVSDRTPRHGTRQYVVARGLATGEKVTVKYRGHVVATGKAGPTGRFRGYFRAGPAGKRTIKVTGQFPSIRNATTTLRVG